MRTLLFCGFVLLLAGCTHSQEVRRTDAEAWASTADEDLAGESGTLELASGARVSGEFLAVSADSVTILPGGRDVPRQVPMDSVRVMRTRLDVLGPIGGALAGGLMGGVIGGLLSADDIVEKGPLGFVSTMDKALLGFAVGAAAGGAIVGVATAAQEYRVVRPSP
jgi:hypothetical protein